MALFEITGDSQKDKGESFLLGTDKDGHKIHVWVRRIPQSIAEDLEAKTPGKWKRKLGRRVRTTKEEFRVLQEKLKWAITQIDGPIVAPLDDEAVKLFSGATGQKCEIGKDIILNGNLNDETKSLLLEYVPSLHGKVLDFLGILGAVAEEEEEAATENLSRGSSGNSRPTSQK